MSLCILGAIAMMASAKPSTQSIITESWKKTLVIGHRGAAAYKPENTLPSFEEAIASKAVATECDVYESSDGEVVIMHDTTLDRTTKLKGLVEETPWSTLKAAGVPSLKDLIQITKDRIVVVVEIKKPKIINIRVGPGIEGKVVQMLEKSGLRDQSIVFSFGEEHIVNTKKADPRYFSVWLVGKTLTPAEYTATLDKAKELGANGIGFQYRNVTPELVKAAHDRKVPVFVWTVPPGPEVDRLKALKVNFIITDHPRDVLKQLEG